MKAKEFIEVMRADMVTHPDKEMLDGVVDAMAEVLNGYTGEINPKKNAEECFKKLRDVAKSKQKNSCYYMPPSEAKKIITDYLEISEQACKDVKTVNLEDFF